MPVKVGVIGVGYLGKHHARIYSEIEGAELVAVADPSREAVSAVAGAYGCKFYTDYRDIIGLCDALSIVTPTTTHYAIAMECLKAGKDLLIEKPVTADISEAQAVVAEAARQNLVLQVGHLERYNPGIAAAAGIITVPSFIESERLSPFMGRADDVDVTIDLMIHDIDIVLSLVNARLTDIRAAGESIITDKIDVARAWLEFDNGCKALVTASRAATDKVRTLKVSQKDSYVTIDYQKQEVTHYVKSGKTLSSVHIRPENREPLKEELKDFILCVQTRQRPRVSGVEGMNALDVALRITEIVKAGFQVCC